MDQNEFSRHIGSSFQATSRQWYNGITEKINYSITLFLQLLLKYVLVFIHAVNSTPIRFGRQWNYVLL